MNPGKRKSTAADEYEEGTAKRRFIEEETTESESTNKLNEVPSNSEDVEEDAVPSSNHAAEDTVEPSKPQAAAPAPTSDRMARFKALQARQASARKQNLKESQNESQRQSIDPNMLNALQRKHAVAAHKLLKAETADAGEDFERKRAWDWTIEESEKWDARMAEKAAHRRDVAFQDYSQDARKGYDRDMKNVKADLASYEQQKMKAIEAAANSGGLEIVETETGELIAVDRDGSFYSTAERDLQNGGKKPSKDAVDRLVNEIKKADAERMEKRRKRLKEQGVDDGGDVTYINVKNKQFNDKLKRFYDKYTGDIRESFERGTAI